MKEILIILACVPLYVCNAMCDKLVSATIENKYKLNFIGSEDELNELEYTSCEKCKK